MSEIDEYFTLRMESIRAGSDIEGESVGQIFVEETLDLLSVVGEFNESYPTNDCQDANNRFACNGYAFNENNDELTLFGAYIVDDSIPPRITRKEVDVVIKKLSKFIETAIWSERLEEMIEPTSACYQVARFIKDNWHSISRIRLFVISNAPASERMRAIKLDELNGKPLSLGLWDLKRIYDLERSQGDREEMVIDLSKNPISCLVANNSGDEEMSLLCVMPGELLYELYNEWDSRLLEQNVRSFLSNRRKVNKGIRYTIISEPKHFFAYNNGLTATAEGAKLESTDSGTVITELKNLQIVNGGQTTASIHSAKKKDKADLANITVQMKLTVAGTEEAKAIIPNIARFANSQNKVSEADLASNHPFHIRIEEASRRLMATQKVDQLSQTFWYYERTTGQYLNEQAYLSPGAKKKFLATNPSNQKFTKTDLAKVLMSWDSLPHIVSKGAQNNFTAFSEKIAKEWAVSDAEFNDLYFKALVWKIWVFRILEKKVLKADWYQQYRANVITYSIAMLAKKVKDKGYEWDTLKLWGTSSAPEEIIDELMRLGEIVTANLLQGDSTISNPSEYAKRERFWTKMQDIDCDVKSVEKWLISATKAKAIKKDAKEVQKIDDGIGSQTRVLNTPKKVWQDIEAWLIDDELATPDAIKLLKKAQSIPNKIPTEGECKMLVKHLEYYKERII